MIDYCPGLKLRSISIKKGGSLSLCYINLQTIHNVAPVNMNYKHSIWDTIYTGSTEFDWHAPHRAPLLSFIFLYFLISLDSLHLVHSALDFMSFDR